MWTLWWINCWQRRVKRWFSERSVATCCSHVWWPSAGTCMNLNELVWTCKHVLRYMLFAHVWWLSAGCELETCCSHVDNNDDMVSIWKKDYHQELEFKSLLVLYCSMYIIRYILASCKFDQHKLDNGSSILIANLTSAWSWLSDESRPRSRCRWSETTSRTLRSSWLSRPRSRSRWSGQSAATATRIPQKTTKPAGALFFAWKTDFRLWISLSQDTVKCGSVFVDWLSLSNIVW